MWSLVSGTGFPFCDSFSNQDKQGHAVCNMQLCESQPCFDFLIRAAWRSFHDVDQNGTTKMDKTRRHTLGLCYAWKACCLIPAKENENKTFHKAVIVSLTTQNQDYEDIKSRMRKMLRASSFNHPAPDQKCAGRSGEGIILAGFIFHICPSNRQHANTQPRMVSQIHLKVKLTAVFQAMSWQLFIWTPWHLYIHNISSYFNQNSIK